MYKHKQAPKNSKLFVKCQIPSLPLLPVSLYFQLSRQKMAKNGSVFIYHDVSYRETHHL